LRSEGHQQMVSCSPDKIDFLPDLQSEAKWARPGILRTTAGVHRALDGIGVDGAKRILTALER
jgi:hypothetical protein